MPPTVTQYDRQLAVGRYAQASSRSMGNIFGDIWDVVTSVADGVVSAVHIIPGVDWAGEQMKDFANSTAGKIVLTAFTSGLYGAASGTLEAYTALAPQLASLTFAFPGLMAGDGFTKAYVEELTMRVKQTAQYLSPGAGAALGKFIEPIATAIMNNPSIQAMLAKAADDLPAITKKIVDAGVSEATDYATQKAIDLINKSNDAVNKYFDNYGNEVDAAGNRKLGASANAELAALNAGIAYHARGEMRTPDWLLATQKSGSEMLTPDWLRVSDAAPAANAARLSASRKQALAGGALAFLSALILMKVVLK